MLSDRFDCYFWQDLEMFQIRGFPSAFLASRRLAVSDLGRRGSFPSTPRPVGRGRCVPGLPGAQPDPRSLSPPARELRIGR